VNALPAVSIANFVPEFERVAAQLPGGSAVLERRRAALSRFAATGFPNMREEAWKYTNVAPLARKNFTMAADSNEIDRASVTAIRGSEWAGVEYVFVNGRCRRELSQPDTERGVSVRSLADVLEEDSGRAESIRGLGDVDVPALVALNAAFTGDGAYIEINDNVVLGAPIRLLFLMGAGRTVACFPRVIIRAGKGAKACVVETYVGVDDAEGFSSPVTEIVADEGANVEHYRLQDEAHKAFHIGSLFVEQSRASSVTLHSLSFGALLARQDIHVNLNAVDAAVTLNGLYMADGRQHVDHHTRIDHLQPHTRSREYYKGVLGGHGRGVFNGKVVVHPQAFKTDARQSNKNLLLSKDAEVDTKPELEIYADDVQCAHGATVGQLDANAVFYLRSRGLDEPTARGLLTYAFAGDIVSRIGIEGLRHELAARIAGRLPDAPQLTVGI
jgi:Fe-S cluster assembly protein SufD